MKENADTNYINYLLYLTCFTLLHVSDTKIKYDFLKNNSFFIIYQIFVKCRYIGEIEWKEISNF